MCWVAGGVLKTLPFPPNIKLAIQEEIYFNSINVV